MGGQTADLLQTAIKSAARSSSGFLAAAIGIITLIITASGVFTEMQQTLNVIWRAAPQGTTVSRLVRARAANLGLVAALGFLLLVSLVVSALLTALSDYIEAYLPFGDLILQALTFVISFGFVSLLFAAIYKILPDRNIEWHDVMVGAVVTAFLFTVGKSLIGLYIGSSSIASSYGAAGSLITVLLWIYYSAQIFLLGPEFTKVYAARRGSHQSGRHHCCDCEVEHNRMRTRFPIHERTLIGPQRASSCAVITVKWPRKLWMLFDVPNHEMWRSSMYLRDRLTVQGNGAVQTMRQMLNEAPNLDNPVVAATAATLVGVGIGFALSTLLSSKDEEITRLRADADDLKCLALVTRLLAVLALGGLPWHLTPQPQTVQVRSYCHESHARRGRRACACHPGGQPRGRRTSGCRIRRPRESTQSTRGNRSTRCSDHRR